jgi:hypothetical protein
MMMMRERESAREQGRTSSILYEGLDRFEVSRGDGKMKRRAILLITLIEIRP